MSTEPTTCVLCDEPVTNEPHDDGTPHQPRVEHQFGEYQPREWDTGFPGGHECQVCGEWFSPEEVEDDGDRLHCEA